MEVVLAALLICGVSMLVFYAIVRSEERQFDKNQPPPTTARHSRNS